MKHENRSLRPRYQNNVAQARASWASDVSPLWSRRLRVEPLESRQLLTAVSWDGGGDGTNWSDPINWSGNALPGVADDVTISVVGTITVTHASGNTTIRSVNSDENLVISGGTMTVTNGASVVSGSFNIGSSASLAATNATATFTASGATTIDGSNLFATQGGQLNLALATSYAESPGNLTRFVANGAGSQIDLSSVTSLTGTTGLMNIYAQAGGTVKMSALASTTARDINFQVDGATSVLNLTALTSATDTTLQSSLALANGGTLTAPALATYTGGSIVVTNMTAALATLTNIDSSSLGANANGILTLAGVTSYAEAPSNFTQFWAIGVNAQIDLSNLTSLTGTTGFMNIYAQAGGTVNMSALASTTARDINFQVDGATSVLNLTALTSATDTTLQSSLALAHGGTLTAPALATYTGGSIVVTNMTAALATLTNIDSSSLFANANGILTLAGVTSYASEDPWNAPQCVANGANAMIDLSNLTSLTGTGGGMNFFAQAGGTVKISALASTTAWLTRFQADGASSVLNLTALTSVNDLSQASSLTVANSGSAMLSPISTDLTGVSVAANSSGVISGGTIQLNGTSTLIGNGGTIQGNVINASWVLPGAPPGVFLGKITFTGNYSQTAAGNYSVELNGLTPITQYDQIAVQGTVSLAGTLTITRGFTPSIGDSFTIIDNDGADAVVGTFAGAPEGDIYTINTIPFRLSYVGGDGNDVTLTRVDNLNARRFLFYNQSGTSGRYDNNDPAINAADDLAIATDKTAYLPAAGPATFANVSSYTKGINGIMVDLAGPHGTLSLSDFEFRVGNNNSPSTWGTANLPTSMSVRAGAGYRGADRIEFIWTTGAPIKQWLEVITLANATTNLPQKVGYPAGQGDVFFFGNAVGNVGTGDTSANSLVTAADEAAIRANPALVSANIPITNIYDVNRSASVSAVDESAARLNGTNPTTTLKYLNLSSPPLAPQGDGGDDGAIASALVATPLAGEDATSASSSATPGGAASQSVPGEPTVTRQLLHWARGNTPRARAILATADSGFGSGDLDDELLAALAGRWNSGP